MSSNRIGSLARKLAAAALMLGAGAPAAAQSGGSFLDLLLYGGAPPPLPPSHEEVDCPAVSITEGGAALRSYVGGKVGSPDALRNQLSIANVARECIGRPDGSILVKVGVEGRALIGPAGTPGQFEAPLRFVIKRGDAVLASRARRATVAVPQGQLQGTFTAVEDGLVVPPNTGDFDIEVGLGGPIASERPARKARRG